MEPPPRPQPAASLPDDDLQCDIRFAVGAGVSDHRYVIVGERDWYDYTNDYLAGFRETARDAKEVTQDLLYCPGWAVPLTTTGLDQAIKWAAPTVVEIDGVPSNQYELGGPELIASGFLPPDSGITVEWFRVNTSLDGPWVLGLELDLVGRANAFRDVFGDGFKASGRSKTKVTYRMRLTQVNDPDLAVTPISD